MTHEEENNRKEWMNDVHWECAKFLADVYGGFHHVCGEIKKSGAGGIYLQLDHVSFATFDFDEMTKIVFMAHDRCIRFGVAGPRMEEAEHEGHTYEVPVMTILVSGRKRDGSMSERHPPLEKAIHDFREKYPQSPQEGQE